ncbi:MAG: universal stress protein [Planctomycetota bacterium]
MDPKHILFPTDLSDLSLRPVERAPELFLGRKVTFMTVVSQVSIPAPASPFAPPLAAPDIGARLDAARQALEALRARLPADADVDCLALASGSAGEVIASWAHEHGVDLIVLSTHGRTGLRRLALGSVAEAVLRHARVPVLAFPDKEEVQ